MLDELVSILPPNVLTICREFMTFHMCTSCKKPIPKAFGCIIHPRYEQAYVLQSPVSITYPQFLTSECETDAEILAYAGIPFANTPTGHYPAGMSLVLSDTLFFFQNAANKILLNAPPNTQHSKQLKFIHITKTGGSSIETWAQKRGIFWGKYHQDYGSWAPKIPARGPWHTFFTLQRESLRSKFNWFVVVRNPYDRILSEVYCPFAGRDRPKRIIGEDTISREQFNTYIQRKINERYQHGDHYSEQHLYVLPGVHILRFENLKNEFANLMTEYGLPNVLDVHINRTVGLKEPKFTLLDFSQATLDLINTVYLNDFKQFGYVLVPVASLAALGV